MNWFSKGCTRGHFGYKRHQWVISDWKEMGDIIRDEMAAVSFLILHTYSSDFEGSLASFFTFAILRSKAIQIGTTGSCREQLFTRNDFSFRLNHRALLLKKGITWVLRRCYCDNFERCCAKAKSKIDWKMWSLLGFAGSVGPFELDYAYELKIDWMHFERGPKSSLKFCSCFRKRRCPIYDSD